MSLFVSFHKRGWHIPPVDFFAVPSFEPEPSPGYRPPATGTILPPASEVAYARF
jgi:hypothetical protein